MKKDWLINTIIAILVIITIALIYIFAQTAILKRPYANIFGYSVFEVKTGSMEPTIEIGDIIIVKLDEPFGQDDIITFQEANYLITHRVISIQDDYIITKGDNNNTEDEPIKRDNVIGKVIYTFDVNVWKKVFTEPKVIICITLTFILFITLILYKGKVGVNKDDEEDK